MPRRIRQHVNPLSAKYLVPRASEVPIPAHLGPNPPLEVELGCADGQFSFQLAKAQEETFVVGLDIREKVIEQNRRKARELGLENLAFGYVNMNVDLQRVFSPGSVSRFHLLFPDPWFKGKHSKRRVMDDALVVRLADLLHSEGEVHVASDVFEIALQAMHELESPGARILGFRPISLDGPWSFWRGNPFVAASKREDTTLARGQRVWRLRYKLGA